MLTSKWTMSRRTRNLTKSVSAPQGVDPSSSETHKVKVISPRSKVTGAKCHVHLHLSLMGSQSTDTGWPHWHQYHEHRMVHKNPKLKVIVPRSKVTGPKFHAHAHLCLMGSPQAQAGQIGINSLDAGWSTRFPRSMS